MGPCLLQSWRSGPGDDRSQALTWRPDVLKCKGRPLFAYLPGAFIEITEVEGTHSLFRKGNFRGKCGHCAGKMLLSNRGESASERRMYLDYLVKHSPMLKGGVIRPLGTGAAPNRTSIPRNHYLSHPIYFNMGPEPKRWWRARRVKCPFVG